MAFPARRTVMPVSKDRMAASLRFYQDVVGLTVFYDQVLTSTDDDIMGIPPPVSGRLVSLQGDGSTIGMVGFFQFDDESIVVPPFERRPGSPIPLGFVFHTTDIEGVRERASTAGATVLRELKTYEIPGRGSIRVFFLLDPNGISVEIAEGNQ